MRWMRMRLVGRNEELLRSGVIRERLLVVPLVDWRPPQS